jgi:sulfur-oxidizing protein SoxB
MQLLAVAAAQGMPMAANNAYAAAQAGSLYDLGKARGNVTLMHMTDCHAQLLPSHFREPDINIGIADARGRVPHLAGEALLKQFGIRPGTREAHAYTHLDFVNAARTFGKVGGFAGLATLIKQIRAQRPGALLLDGGDTWQGSATALWSNGQDMVEAALLLQCRGLVAGGVDALLTETNRSEERRVGKECE